MKLFVTGGTGFVGSHVVQQLIAAGHDVVALRRPGSKPRIPLRQDPTWIDGPLDGNYASVMQGVEVMVHLATHSPNPPYASLEECIYWNVFASIKLARQASASGVKKYLIAGSCFEYGRAGERVEAIATNTPLEPTMSYSASKAAASIAFAGLAREFSLKLKILRIFHVYGEGELATRMWPSLRAAALSGTDFPMTEGAQLRDFIAVEDVAKQFLEHLDFSDVDDGEPSIIHVASGKSCTILEFAEHWWRVWNATGRLLPGALPYRENEMMKLVPLMDVRC